MVWVAGKLPDIQQLAPSKKCRAVGTAGGCAEAEIG